MSEVFARRIESAVNTSCAWRANSTSASVTRTPVALAASEVPTQCARAAVYLTPHFRDPQLAEGLEQGLAAAGLDCVFLQFDGVSDESYQRIRGARLAKLKEQAIARCGDVGLGVVDRLPGLKSFFIRQAEGTSGGGHPRMLVGQRI